MIFLLSSTIFSARAEEAMAPTKIWTDKADYSPGETVTIFGSGFLHNTAITVNITRPDGHVDTSLDQGAETIGKISVINESSDAYGNFTATYQLDGIEGYYKVVATDGMNTDEYIFTDMLLSVGVSPDYITVSPGETAIYKVKVWKVPLTGATYPYLYLIGTLPTGATTNFPTEGLQISMPIGDWVDNIPLNISTTTSTPEGTYTFYIKANDTDNQIHSDAFALIVYNEPPEGTIKINGGAPYTNSTSATLTLTYSDDMGVAQVRYSNDGTWDTETWESPSTTKSWELIPGDGLKTVYFQIKDSGGNLASFSDTIFLNAAGHSPIADAQVREAAPNRNFGDNHLSVGYGIFDFFERFTYIKFDLSDIPEGATITSAKLHLHVNFLTWPTAPRIFGCNDTWSESQITWNNAPTPLVPAIGGGSQDNREYYGYGTTWGWWFGWDVTEYANSQVNGDNILSLVLLFQETPGLFDYIDYSSREGKVRNRPWLELYYYTSPPVGGEWVPIDTMQVLLQIVGSAVATSAIAASFVGLKRIKKKQN